MLSYLDFINKHSFDKDKAFDSTPRMVTENYPPKNSKYYVFTMDKVNGKYRLSKHRQEFDDETSAKHKMASMIEMFRMLNDDTYKSLRMASGKELQKLVG